MPNRFWSVPHDKRRTAGRGRSLRAPYRLEIIESCLSSGRGKNQFFDDLPAAAVQRLAEISSIATYPKGATLFVEGQTPHGVFLVCSGRVKLSSSSAGGRTRIVNIADPGELLCLAATLCGKPSQATADALEPAQVNFIRRQDCLNFLGEHAEAALRVAQQLSESYHRALSEMRTIGWRGL